MQALIVCKQNQRAYLLARKIADRIAKGGGSAIVCERDIALYDPSEVDTVMVLGGDGTILKAGRYFARLNIPILGVNLGQVGFLSSIEADQAIIAVDKILRKDYHVDERLMLQVTVNRNRKQVFQTLILNDIVVRAVACQITQVEVITNGESCTIFRGDGVICATPTGSTGYSLSAGGAVLEPTMAAMVITPICPQLASNRSLILSADSELKLVLESDRSTRLYADGSESIDLQEGDDIQVERSQVNARIIRLDNVNPLAKLSHLSARSINKQLYTYDASGEIF